MHSSGQDHKTAKGIFFVLGLAVLFLFILSLFQFWACRQAGAVGLKIKLLEKDPDVVLFGPPPHEVALSISSDSIPLLRNNLGFTQKVCIDYDQRFVNISESCGNYQFKKPIFLPLSDYTNVGSWVQTDESWRKNLNTHFQGERISPEVFSNGKFQSNSPRWFQGSLGRGDPA